MSVTRVDVVDIKATNTEDFHREYDLTYRVITDSESDGPDTVLASGSLPTYGQPYAYGSESNPFASCRFVGNARRDQGEKTRKAWLVDAKFSTRGSNRDPNDQPGKPLDWAWKVSGSFGTGQKYSNKDRTGRALANSANEPFEDVPPIDDQILLLTLEKNLPTLSLSQWADSRGKVNDATLWGLPARRVKLMQWSWTPQWTGAGQAYVACKWEVAINFDGYYYEPRDEGYREITGVDAEGLTTYAPILINGELPSKPEYLNGSGERLNAAFDPVYFNGVGGNPDPFEIEEEYDLGSIFPAVLPGPITA